MEGNKPSAFEAVVLVGAIFLVAVFFLVTWEGGSPGEEPPVENQPVGEAVVARWYMADGTEDIGPEFENLVEIRHTDWPLEGSEVAPDDDLGWSGEIRWTGSENENMGTYGRSNLGIHLIISRVSGTNELNVGLLLGDYSVGMGVPRPAGVTGDWVYVDHDSQTIPELGGSVPSAPFDLSVTY